MHAIDASSILENPHVVFCAKIQVVSISFGSLKKGLSKHFH
jgi:hypothetical protein